MAHYLEIQPRRCSSSASSLSGKKNWCAPLSQSSSGPVQLGPVHPVCRLLTAYLLIFLDHICCAQQTGMYMHKSWGLRHEQRAVARATVTAVGASILPRRDGVPGTNTQLRRFQRTCIFTQCQPGSNFTPGNALTVAIPAEAGTGHDNLDSELISSRRERGWAFEKTSCEENSHTPPREVKKSDKLRREDDSSDASGGRYMP